MAKKEMSVDKLRSLISEDFGCTCNTYKKGFTDSKLYDDMLEVIKKHGQSFVITENTIKLLLISVLELKHKSGEPSCKNHKLNQTNK